MKSETFELPATAGHEACVAVHAFLTAARGRPVRLSGAGVRTTGARMALMLLAARRAWALDKQPFELADPSPPLRAGLERLGLAAELLAQEAAA
ncbi:hypothetical protein OG2516_05423 [Oceanicola granulosus HTCC2516]|uniref:STAS domain-containing protein n=1 Tax=Oceanicola granulosus (strain ATCC BAA-861 / DSM 15982 / KCTC 12143 / HTCC2516) TaxID=314256 RepID=Q2CIR7_OCEGH|nr:hypothetical protein [Oceanicola granulosus]EAR52522.1 hypothetical protein OG2516_05423 [Oceanicola granulosus HTCC2516]